MELTEAGRPVLMHWVESEVDSWMKDHGFYEWRCYCGAEVAIIWHTSGSLLDAEDGLLTLVGPDAANSSSWEVECHNGHTLLICHEMDGDGCADNYEPPSTQRIAQFLASREDVKRWQEYVRPRPPWNQGGDHD
jgi:hypothetical protein